MKETALTIDHDTGRIRADTTSKRMRSLFIRAGLRDISKTADLGPYWSFEGDESQIRIAKRHRTGRVSGVAAILAAKKAVPGRKKRPK